MLIFLPIMLSSNSQQIATCSYYSQCIAHYSHMFGVKGWHQMYYEYKSTIAKSIYDTAVVNYNTAVHIVSCNPHI